MRRFTLRNRRTGVPVPAAGVLSARQRSHGAHRKPGRPDSVIRERWMNSSG